MSALLASVLVGVEAAAGRRPALAQATTTITGPTSPPVFPYHLLLGAAVLRAVVRERRGAVVA